MPTSAIHRLAEFVSGHDAHPEDGGVDSIRLALVDTMGCIAAGAQRSASASLRMSLASWGTGSAAVYGSGARAPAPWAALANGTASHAIEFDDWESPGNTHPSGVLFPAILAATDGRPASGREIIEAYAVGFEVITRIGEAINFDHYAAGWHATGTLGALGAAAAASRITGLDRAQTAHALSIGASQMGGFTAQVGADAKALQAGFAARAGVTAAAFAATGMTGHSHILERSIVPLMGPGDVDRLDRALSDLGGTLDIDRHGLVIKPYPTCGYAHRVIECAEALHDDRVDADQIASIRTSLIDFHAAIVPYAMPADADEAMFSVPFGIAAALVEGTVTRSHIDEKAWLRPDIARLIELTLVETREPLDPNANLDANDPDWVEVSLLDGTVLRTECAFPVGTPQHPMEPAVVLEKFHTNAPWIDRMTSSQLLNWPHADDVAAVLSPLEAAP